MYMYFTHPTDAMVLHHAIAYWSHLFIEVVIFGITKTIVELKCNECGDIQSGLCVLHQKN